jgi:hypothetical protein
MNKALSGKMAAWLGHVRAAGERGMSVRAYASAKGLSANAMYQAKSQLMKVGALPRSSAPGRAGKAAKRSGFIAARVVASAGSVQCRLSHVSGWRIECESLPPAEWLASVLRSAAHVAG